MTAARNTRARMARIRLFRFCSAFGFMVQNQTLIGRIATVGVHLPHGFYSRHPDFRSPFRTVY